uniref:Uncharacterized protein n=1 Tax=Arion vulgaris TaxID=1028688 RepID=A0A0B6ZVP6_9EUPU
MQKYSSIEQNPLMWELFSGILQEKEAEANWEKLCQHIGEGKAGMWSPCLLG